uniref:Uncharacterized protein n=1 Tax=Cannabis sativa TaxID=3483 RepID=A0A803R578_CANSA
MYELLIHILARNHFIYEDTIIRTTSVIQSEAPISLSMKRCRRDMLTVKTLSVYRTLYKLSITVK